MTFPRARRSGGGKMGRVIEEGQKGEYRNGDGSHGNRPERLHLP